MRAAGIAVRRADIELTELRKQIFFEASQKERYQVQLAAISHNFNLTYPEFLTILEQPTPEKERMLVQLIHAAQDLSLCFYNAINDALDDMREYTSSDEAVFMKKLKSITPSVSEWQKEQLREVGLYRLARDVADEALLREQDEELSLRDEVAFLIPSIVAGDTWRTFMAFSTALKQRYPYKMPQTLEEYLISFVRDDIDYALAEEDTDTTVRIEVRVKGLEIGVKELETCVKELEKRFTEMIEERFTRTDIWIEKCFNRIREHFAVINKNFTDTATRINERLTDINERLTG